MFDRQKLEEALDLQERSYRLLKWVNSSLAGDVLRFDVVHDAMSAAEATEEWIRRHLANFPPDARPAEDQMHRFAMYFSSYLSTSFELVESPEPNWSSRSGGRCWCHCCRYLSATRHLKTRKIKDKAKQDALTLKRVWLEDLALSPAEIDRLIGDRELAEDIALASWSNEMMRRMEFASQGIGVLALWREFAWKDRVPIKKFRLTAEKILEADARIAEAINAL